MVPEPVEVPVWKSMADVCSMVRVPVAPAIRPVPPTIVAVTVTCEMFGGVN